LLSLLEREYDPTWRFIGEYALGTFGWMMPLAFLAFAISLFTHALTIGSQVRTVIGYVGLALNRHRGDRVFDGGDLSDGSSDDQPGGYDLSRHDAHSRRRVGLFTDCVSVAQL